MPAFGVPSVQSRVFLRTRLAAGILITTSGTAVVQDGLFLCNLLFCVLAKVFVDCDQSPITPVDNDELTMST